MIFVLKFAGILKKNEVLECYSFSSMTISPIASQRKHSWRGVGGGVCKSKYCLFSVKIIHC